MFGKRAKITGLHFHDLRREAGSRWLEGGVQLHTVRDWLGHSTIEQTSTYLKNTARSKHDATEAYERRTGRVQPRPTDSSTGGQKSPPSATNAEQESSTKQRRRRLEESVLTQATSIDSFAASHTAASW
jgi:hypothetical protein